MSKRKVVVDRSGITAGQLRDFWRMVEDGTIDGRVFGYMLNNVTPLRKEALKGDFVTLVRAREIMGQNFFGPGDAEQYLGTFGTELPKAADPLFQQVPFSEELLREHESDCVLIAVPNISVGEIIGLVQEHAIPFTVSKGSNLTHPLKLEGLEKRAAKTGWHLLSKETTEQIAACYCGHAQEFNPETPLRMSEVSAPVLLYSTVAYFLATGRTKSLFGDKLVGSSDLSSHTNRFCVGFTPQCQCLNIELEFADDCD